MSLRVALVNPPQPTKYPQPPMGLALIAAVLEKEGYQVTIIDANASHLRIEDIMPHIIDFDVIGLTAMTPTINTAIEIARQIKLANPDLFIILGGCHATLLPEETLTSAPEVNVIVQGEGEKTIIDLLQALEHDLPLDDIHGITYRRDGKVVSNIRGSTDIDLDSLPFPAYHLLPWQRYKPHPPYGRVVPFATIITSRGCPYNCAYCSKPIFGNKFRGQSAERVLEEIAYYKEKFGVKEIAFYDDIFTLNKNRAQAIADGIVREKLDILWTCETRVNLVDKELLRCMKKAGCYAIAYGIESASQDILDILHKDITLEQVEEAVRITHEAGIQTVGYFMIGSPDETPETIRKTIQFAKKLKLDFAQFAITTPFPGTELYEMYSGSKKGNVSWDNFFYEKAGNKVIPVFENDSLNQDDLQYWSRRAYREFYLRPYYLYNRIRQITSFGDLKVNFKGLAMLFEGIKK
ncbi:B12-binding domain-containing radical SAM protein [Chloroflexota bacterium]